MFDEPRRELTDREFHAAAVFGVLVFLFAIVALGSAVFIGLPLFVHWFRVIREFWGF